MRPPFLSPVLERSIPVEGYFVSSTSFSLFGVVCAVPWPVLAMECGASRYILSGKKRSGFYVAFPNIYASMDFMFGLKTLFATAGGRKWPFVDGLGLQLAG